MTRVLVTGGAGFIGSTLVDRLLAEGHPVTVLDDLSSGKLHNLQQARRAVAAPLSFVRLDLVSDGLERAVAKAQPEVVVHLAAQVDVRRSVLDPVRDAMVNVVGTVNLLEACRRHGVGRVVLITSGGSIYGEPQEEDLPVGEEHGGHPGSPYGAGKRGAEEYLHAYEAMYGLRWTCLALANVYGPRQDPGGEAGVVAVFAGRMLAGQPVTIYGDGEQTRDFVFVEDVVEACLAVLAGGDGVRTNVGTGQRTTPDGARIHVGTGQRTSVNALFERLAELTGYSRAPIHAPPRAGELRHMALRVDRAEHELGWRPRTGLREGLAATLAWLQR